MIQYAFTPSVNAQPTNPNVTHPDSLEADAELGELVEAFRELADDPKHPPALVTSKILDHVAVPSSALSHQLRAGASYGSTRLNGHGTLG